MNTLILSIRISSINNYKNLFKKKPLQRTDAGNALKRALDTAKIEYM